VIPANMLSTQVKEDYKIHGFASPEEKAAIEKAAMDAVFVVEKELSNIAKDRSKEKIGYDIESLCSQTGNLRFIEVKGRKKDATTVTITKNEIIYGLNLPEQFILALAFVDGKRVEVHYVQNAFRFEPDFGVTSIRSEKIGYDIERLCSQTGNLRVIEVKGRKKDATTVTITKNEIIYGLNLPEQFILALAFVDGKRVEVHYVQNAFRFEPDFGVTSINFNVKDLLTKTVHRRTITLD